MKVVVTGAGTAGLSCSLFLARAGHDVVVLERDATPLPESAEAAFDWDRRGAPQVRHSHAFLARLRNLLRDRLPDVLEDLLAAGALEVGWQDMAPPTLEDLSPRPGDEDLVLLACRRTTFEWVLRRAALRTERVQLIDGVGVNGLVAGSTSGRPTVTGVHADVGVVNADLVVDAGGRRSALPTLLAELGVLVPEDEQDTGIIYLSRFYRLLPGASEPDQQPLVAGDLGYLKYGVFRGDNRTFSVTLAIGSADAELRSVLDPASFEAACRLVPAIEHWVEPGRSTAITSVHVMAGLINRIRRLVVNERPLALGIVAAGDASVCTNPLYGRGCSLGMVHASLLTAAVDEHGADHEALTLQFDAATEQELVPWYRAAVLQDEVSKKALHGESSSDGSAFLQSVLSEGLFPLARIDAEVHRALVRTMNLLSPPDALMLNEDISRRVLAFWQERDSRPPEPPLGPEREELVAALARTAPSRRQR